MSPFEAPYQPEPRPSGAEFCDAVWAAALLAVDPGGLGGITIRAWSGPARDDFLARINDLFPRSRKMPLGIADDRLLGGLDLPATLQAGRPVFAAGLLAEAAGGVLVLAMAERISAPTAAKIAAAMDSGGGFALIALDEGAGPDEAPPGALLERMAFAIGALPGETAWPTARQIESAEIRLAKIAAGDKALTQICAAAAMLGTGSIRGETFALRAACAAAALRGHAAIESDDIALGVRLVLGPRATQMPAPPEPPPPAPEDDRAEDRPNETPEALEDSVTEAAVAKLPPELLAALAAGGPRRSKSGAGKSGVAASTKRGRPAGSRPGALAGGAKLSLLDTLRAAAPWQKLRPQPGGASRIAVRAEDFRIKKFKEQPRRIAIFAVDASGSSAINRLAEAKGAIQLLLAECYVRRDQVALLAFRGQSAECLLPPTHALARAKRALAGLPGGGPTPLATGITAARALAGAEGRKGHQPLLVLLTDGGANIGRDGKPGRAAAAADALAAAKLCRAENLAALVVDTAPRGNSFVATLARDMGGKYLKLPYADAASLSRAVQAHGGTNVRVLS
jgi:magnesium chelatase subunit D